MLGLASVRGGRTKSRPLPSNPHGIQWVCAAAGGGRDGWEGSACKGSLADSRCESHPKCRAGGWRNMKCAGCAGQRCMSTLTQNAINMARITHLTQFVLMTNNLGIDQIPGADQPAAWPASLAASQGCNVPRLQCSNVAMFQRCNVQMLQCSNVPKLLSSNFPLLHCSNVHVATFHCSNGPVLQFSNVAMV